MNIKDLKYFVAVAETMHFGKAAKQCFVSQPTLSTQLKKLEDSLGVKLFERTNKSTRITPVGQSIVKVAREILTKVDEIKTLALHAKDPLSGPFRLGIIPTLGPYLLPHIIKPIQKMLPKIELVIVENKTKTILEHLHQGLIDAVILALPVNTEQLECVELFAEPFYAAIPKKHQLALKPAVTMKELAAENLLLLEEGHCLREQALEACRFNMKPKQAEFSATSLETLRQIVGLGAGITFLPALSVASAKSDKNLVIKEIKGDVPARRVGFLFRKSSVLADCAFKLARLIAEKINELPQVAGVSRKKPLTKVLD